MRPAERPPVGEQRVAVRLRPIDREKLEQLMAFYGDRRVSNVIRLIIAYTYDTLMRLKPPQDVK